MWLPGDICVVWLVNPCCGQQVVSFDGFGLEPAVCFPYHVGGYVATVFDIHCLNNRSVFGIRDLNVSNGSKARTGHGKGFHLPQIHVPVAACPTVNHLPVGRIHGQYGKAGFAAPYAGKMTVQAPCNPGYGQPRGSSQPDPFQLFQPHKLLEHVGEQGAGIGLAAFDRVQHAQKRLLEAIAANGAGIVQAIRCILFKRAPHPAGFGHGREPVRLQERRDYFGVNLMSGIAARNLHPMPPDVLCRIHALFDQ